MSQQQAQAKDLPPAHQASIPQSQMAQRPSSVYAPSYSAVNTQVNNIILEFVFEIKNLK